MQTTPINELLKNQDKLEGFLFKENSSTKIINAKFRLFLIIPALILLLSAYIFMFLSMWHPQVMLWSILLFSTMTVTLILMILNSILCYRHLLNKYPVYTIKYDLLVNYSSFFRAYRAEQLRLHRTQFKIDSSNIDNYIEYYEAQWSEKNQSNWGKFGILAIILLPIWNEFVGKNITEKLDSKLLIIITLAFAIAIISIFFRTMIQAFFFININKKKDIVEILKLLKRSFNTSA
ncbi:hypothetical protein [Paenibacillus kandeliae]|uniref:hypothetical protein n=1 Tax=Paenibacillus kandeliae TaxID=3231269 RepID=UPI003457D258